MADLARAIDAIPVVATLSERDLLFPTPARDQRVELRSTGAVYKYDGVRWILDVPTLREVHVERFGAVGDGVTDDSAAFQAAIDSLLATGPGCVTVDETKTYAIASTVLIRGVGVWVNLGGRRSANFFGGPTIKWTGPLDDTAVMFKVTSTSHGAGLAGGLLDANLKAGICLQVVNGTGAIATYGPTLGNTTFTGYRKRGLVLGLDTDETAPVVSNMAMGVVNAPNLYFHGGLLGAIGVLVNAQNAEWTNFDGIYFDPPSDAVAHKHHIFQAGGGLAITAMISTRCTDYALYLRESCVINGWNAEDRYLVRHPTADPGGALVFNRVLHRDNPGPSGSPLAADATFDIAGMGSHALHVSGVTLQGSFRLGGTDKITIEGGINFLKAGAGFVFSSVYNQRGWYGRPDTGSYKLRGPSAAITLYAETTADNAPAAEIGLNGVQIPAFTTATLPNATTYPNRIVMNTTLGFPVYSYSGAWYRLHDNTLV